MVIGVSPSTKRIQLSDLPHLVGEKALDSPVEHRFQPEEMLKMNVEWVLTGSNHVVFKTPSKTDKAVKADEEGRGNKAGGEIGQSESIVTRGFFNEAVKNPTKFAKSKKV